MDPFVAEIRIFTGNFAPTGWALCNGQLMPIQQNTALFSLLGTTYGGDGKSTFALPNMVDRSPMFWGQGPGLSLRDIGEISGEASVTLLQSEMPAHAHSISGTNVTANQPSPTGNLWGSLAGRTPPPLYSTNNPNTSMGPGLAVAGSSFPHNNMQPFLGLTFIIALQGVFPPRS
jgi:microcystin-dependent protein